MAAPLKDKAATGTRSTTKAFLVPMSMEWSMMANHGSVTGLTSLSRPRPKRSDQLMTEVKCGIQLKRASASILNKLRILGTLRKETTACITNNTQTARTSCAELNPIICPLAGVKVFFYPN